MDQSILNKIAQSLEVTIQDVTEMNNRLQAHDGSLNTLIGDCSTENGLEWMDFISDSKPNQEEVFSQLETFHYRKKLFNQALNVLNSREKEILFKRRLAEKAVTLDDLSQIYHISKERVRQIEKSAFVHMRQYNRRIRLESYVA